MFVTKSLADWVPWQPGESFGFDPSAAARLTVRSCGQSAAYLVEISDPVSGETVELEQPILLGSGTGEYELRLSYGGNVTIRFVGDEYHGAFKAWAGGHTQPDHSETAEPFTVLKPRTVMSEEMRAMQMLLLQQRQWMERAITEQQLASRAAPPEAMNARNPEPTRQAPDGAEEVQLAPDGAPLVPAPGRVSLSGPAVLDVEPPPEPGDGA